VEVTMGSPEIFMTQSLGIISNSTNEHDKFNN